MMMTMSLMACGEKETVTEGLYDQEEVAEDKIVDEEKTMAEDNTMVEVEPEFENLYPEYILGETETTITYLNAFGTETTITKNPKKVVVLYNSLLGLWYYMGGESIAKVKGTSNVPEEALDLLDLGSSASVSLEAIIALEPDLVIMASNVSATVEMAPSLAEMGVETLIIDAKTKSYERFEENSYLFAKINGTEAMYEEKTAPIVSAINEMIQVATSNYDSVRVAPIFATSKSLSLETDIAQVGEMVSLLGGENIFSAEDIKVEGDTRISFSIEAIVTQNPEVILISTMSDPEASRATLEKMIEENPVWQEVDAVKNDRVYYLDKELSVYKPNQRYAEAFEMIGTALYPDLFSAE